MAEKTDRACSEKKKLEKLRWVKMNIGCRGCLVRLRRTVGKGGGREGRRKEESVFGGFLPRLRRAAALLSGRRGG